MRTTHPTYPLSEVQALVRQRDYRVTAAAARSAGELGFGLEAIVECVLTLSAADFHKSMPAERAAGLWQDVYRPWRHGMQLYVKVQIAAVEGTGSTIDAAERLVVVISFKER